ncbi:hypothetical protein MauCBS54593_000068 [Microsporum audouinii]
MSSHTILGTAVPNSDQIPPFDWSKIPDTTKLQPLPNIAKLKAPPDIYIWAMIVERALKLRKLCCLIDGSVPSTPPTDKALYERWEAADIYVMDWLILQIDYTFYNEIENFNPPMDTAQKFFTSIKQTLGDINMDIYLKKWERMKRSDFSTVAQFVEALSESYREITRTGFPVPPVCGIYRLIYSIEDEMATWATYISLEVEKFKPMDVTKQQFFDICDRTRAKALYSAAAPKPSSNQRRSRLRNRPK